LVWCIRPSPRQSWRRGAWPSRRAATAGLRRQGAGGRAEWGRSPACPGDRLVSLSGPLWDTDVCPGGVELDGSVVPGENQQLLAAR
jgi:hypothetical protein